MFFFCCVRWRHVILLLLGCLGRGSFLFLFYFFLFYLFFSIRPPDAELPPSTFVSFSLFSFLFSLFSFLFSLFSFLFLSFSLSLFLSLLKERNLEVITHPRFSFVDEEGNKIERFLLPFPLSFFSSSYPFLFSLSNPLLPLFLTEN